MLRIPRFLTKSRRLVAAVDEKLLKLVVEDGWRLPGADFEFCVACRTESAAWRTALLRLAEERRRPAEAFPQAASR